ncbi:MAG TPA: acyltransferase domain-containing protein, partial [Phycisphaerae bacterium]|nr:acyltransferase domain-containing protein [Phycisphaerae bacterium]
HRSLPPTIKVEEPNPKLGIEESPFYLNTDLRPWVSRSGRPRRAGVSAFGFGGSNFHAVLDENQAALPEVAWDGSAEIVALSADTIADLNEHLDEWTAYVAQEHFDRTWLAYKAAASRRAFSSGHQHRLILLVEHRDNVAELLNRARSKLASSADEQCWNLPNVFYGTGAAQGKVAFLFPGQGSQYLNMARNLACTFPEVMATLEEANATADDADRRLSDAVFPAVTFSEDVRQRHAAALTRTDTAQPAIGAVSLALARVLNRFGVKPDMVAGHSYGELIALCVAGRFDAETLHRLSRLRGRLMAEGEGDRGTMLAVRAPLDELKKLVVEQQLDVVIANRNAPQQGVLSGDRESIGKAFEACRTRGFAAKALQVSGAFHSKLMASAVGPFRHALEAVAFEPAATPVFANTTGRAYPVEPAAARELLGQQLVKPVDFVGEIENLYDAGVRTFVEVGPKATLTGLVRAILGDRPHQAIALDASAGREAGVLDLARLLAQLAALGHSVELTQWERPAPEPRKPKMVVPLVGANYRATLPKTADADEPGRVRCADHDTPRILVGQNGPPGEPCEVDPQMEAGKAPLAIAQPRVPSTPDALQIPAGAPSRAALSDALQLVQEGLLAMQKLQQQTAEAHQRFLASQEQAHRAIQQLIEGQQQLLARSAGQPSESPVSRAMPAGATQPSLVQQPLSQTVADQARPAPMPENLASAASVSPAAVGSSVESIVLEVVCQKTGYPREMVNLDMDIEGDLGVDSIKRVEILAAVEERLPGWPGVSPEYLGTIRTLR